MWPLLKRKQEISCSTCSGSTSMKLIKWRIGVQKGSIKFRWQRRSTGKGKRQEDGGTAVPSLMEGVGVESW